RRIGQFGIGLYAALQYASRVEIRSAQFDDGSGTLAVLTAGATGVFFEAVSKCRRGTLVTVHLISNIPSKLRDKTALLEYLRDVFVFSPIDIRIGGKPIAGPSVVTRPWDG